MDLTRRGPDTTIIEKLKILARRDRGLSRDGAPAIKLLLDATDVDAIRKFHRSAKLVRNE